MIEHDRAPENKHIIDNPVIIESLFKETNRTGKQTTRLVLLALTRNLLMISSSHSFGASRQHIVEIRSLHPLNSIELKIFKKTERKALKLCLHTRYERYFELDRMRGTDDLWRSWCKCVLLLNTKRKKIQTIPNSLTKSTSYHESILNWESQKYNWYNKHLYLGSKRADEDDSRPLPVQGLGPPEDIKLIHLKPQYFGSWGQTEHWVQCESSKLRVE